MGTEQENSMQALPQRKTLEALPPPRLLSSSAAPARSTGRGQDRTATIGTSLTFEGTLGGLADVVVDGEVEGTIRLLESSLTVGASGRVNADIEVRNLTVLGHVAGKIVCLERMRLCSTGSIDGDVKAPRIVIEDGAVVHGSIEVVKTAAASKAVPQTK